MNRSSPLETEALFLAIGPRQLAAMARAGFRHIEPGGGGELLVLFKRRQRYAEMVARQRILPRDGAAFVVQCHVSRDFLRRFPLSSVAYEEHLEYLVPSDQVAQLGRDMPEPGRVVAKFLPGEAYSLPSLHS